MIARNGAGASKRVQKTIIHYQPLDPDEPEDVRGREIIGAEQLRHGEDPRELHQLLVLPEVPLALGGAC